MLRIGNSVGFLQVLLFRQKCTLVLKIIKKLALATLLLSPAHTGGFHNFLWREDTQANSALIQKEE